jgi:hypothetical protein
MVERMSNSFVVRDTNHSVSWNSESNANEMVGLEDGTSLSKSAFGGGTAMSHFSPAELGINMSAYPGMEEKSATSVSEQESARIQSSSNPFEAPLQQDLQTSGVEFRSEDGRMEKANDFVKENSYKILMGGLFLSAGWWFRGFFGR